MQRPKNCELPQRNRPARLEQDMKSIELTSLAEAPVAIETTPVSIPAVAPSAHDRLSFKTKLGYGLGDTASHFVWDMVGFWLLFFYTDVYKLPAAAAGTIMLIARFWDMGIDPVIGILSDRTHSRWGKFRPYILFGAIPYAVLAILTFSTPNL